MSDMSDDEYQYDSDGSGSSYSFVSGSDDAKSKDGDDGRPHIVPREALLRMFNHDVQSVVDLTALEPGLAGVLLLHVNFNRDMTNTDFFDPRKGAKLRDDAGLESKCPSTVDPDPDIDFSCELCMEDVDFGETFALSCKHRFCKSCFAEHIDAAERNSVFRRCPKGECGLAIGAPAAQQVLPPEQYTKYMNWILERFVTASNRLKYCPTPGCGAVVVNSDLATYPEVTCGSCVKRWCFNCTEEPHRPANCDQVLAWKEKGDDSDLTALYVSPHAPAWCAYQLTPRGGDGLQMDQGEHQEVPTLQQGDQQRRRLPAHDVRPVQAPVLLAVHAAVL